MKGAPREWETILFKLICHLYTSVVFGMFCQELSESTPTMMWGGGIQLGREGLSPASGYSASAADGMSKLV